MPAVPGLLAVPHPSTLLTQCCFTSGLRWDLVYSTWQRRWQVAKHITSHCGVLWPSFNGFTEVNRTTREDLIRNNLHVSLNMHFFLPIWKSYVCLQSWNHSYATTYKIFNKTAPSFMLGFSNQKVGPRQVEEFSSNLFWRSVKTSEVELQENFLHLSTLIII